MMDIKLKMGAMRAPDEMDFNVRPPDWLPQSRSMPQHGPSAEMHILIS